MSNNEFQTERIFLVYANLLFKDDPNNLKAMAEVIKEFEAENYHNIGFNYEREKENYFSTQNPNIVPSAFEPIVDEIIRLSDLGEPRAMMDNQQRRDGQIQTYFLDRHNIAYAAVYRHNDIDPNGRITTCDSCFYFPERTGLPFMSEPRKCFECDQMAFIRMLDQLIEGRELYELPEFRYYLQARNRAVINIVDFNISEDNSLAKPLKEYVSLNTLRHFGSIILEPSNPSPMKDFSQSQYAFSSFLMSFIGYSLTEFLLKSGRSKLKKCQKCNCFFTASKNDFRIKYCKSCSSKNKYDAQKWNEYQRKYRLKKRKEKEKMEREVRIKNIMKRAGYSRKEAIEIIDADSKI